MTPAWYAGRLRQDRDSLVPSGNKQGTSILLVEQNALMALQVANRGYVLETGIVALSDDAKTLAQNPQVRKAYLGET